VFSDVRKDGKKMGNDIDDKKINYDGTLIPGKDGQMMEFSPMTKLLVGGFKAAAVSADIRGQGNDRLDMGLIVAERGATIAGVFTKNELAAAPVRLCRERAEDGKAAAVLVNSGNANSMTGKAGDEDAAHLCNALADRLRAPEEVIFPCSTGVIGVRLPVERMEASLDPLIANLSEGGLESFTRSIMTTDTMPKCAKSEAELELGTATVVGIAKGAGMIAPNMATMLAFILTDARIDVEWQRNILRDSVRDTFNRISVDGDSSTNDTVLLLASGVGPEVRTWQDTAAIQKAVHQVCSLLAGMIISDGEGAKKVVNIKVTGAEETEDALQIARTVADSMLVKTAIAAGDPNWGRVGAAIGRAGVELDPSSLSIRIGEVKVLEKGEIVDGLQEERIAEVMKRQQYDIVIGIGDGDCEGTIRTCDLTEDYIRINCDYRS
jgi:glutamate N-acetyltransferase/amino-acid N-acetyltransferase